MPYIRVLKDNPTFQRSKTVSGKVSVSGREFENMSVLFLTLAQELKFFTYLDNEMR